MYWKVNFLIVDCFFHRCYAWLFRLKKRPQKINTLNYSHLHMTDAIWLQCSDNAVHFLFVTTNTKFPWRRGMGVFVVRSNSDISQSLHYCTQYHLILSLVITAPECSPSVEWNKNRIAHRRQVSFSTTWLSAIGRHLFPFFMFAYFPSVLWVSLLLFRVIFFADISQKY